MKTFLFLCCVLAPSCTVYAQRQDHLTETQPPTTGAIAPALDTDRIGWLNTTKPTELASDNGLPKLVVFSSVW
jgi:hypothetical protein